MIVTREVRAFFVILVLLAISAKIFLGWLAAAILLLLAVPFVYIVRDPRCSVPSAPLGVLSPADGRVVSVETIVDPWLNRPAKRCRIKMSFLDVHTLRSPAEGKIKKQWAAETDEPGLRRRYTYWIQTDEGDDVVLSIAAGRFAPFVDIDLQCGERTGQGQRFGYLYFEGIIDVLLPERTRADLEPGDNVVSGSTILGQLIRSKPGALPEMGSAV